MRHQYRFYACTFLTSLLALVLALPVQVRAAEQSTATLDIQVQAGDDDAEEKVSGGTMSLSSSDLEMVRESSDQLVGIRFQHVTVPKGSTITSAYITFTADERSYETTMLQIQG